MQDITRRLFDRWKAVMVAGQQAKDARNTQEVNIYKQEREFLEKLINDLGSSLPTDLATEWESYQQHSPPDTYFNPDSTDVEPHF